MQFSTTSHITINLIIKIELHLHISNKNWTLWTLQRSMSWQSWTALDCTHGYWVKNHFLILKLIWLLRKRYLPTGDLLVVNDKPVGYRGGQFYGLQPETHVTLLQNLIVQTMFQRNNCTETEDTQRLDP